MWGAAAALAFAAPAGAISIVSHLLDEQRAEARIISIGNRLAVAAGDLCSPQVALAGIQVHDASQYPAGLEGPLKSAFGVGPWPKVLAVAENGAAARAGVHANDSILLIDGMPIAPATRAGSYARVADTLALLDRGLDDGRVTLTLERDGERKEIMVTGDRGCATKFQLKESGDLQGKADGDYVEVTTALFTYALDDAEFAAVIAHELAHNILHHRARLDAAGVQRGILQNFGRSARLTRETEVEADRLSVYLLDRAGYPMEAAPRFWERFGQKLSGFGDQTHPGGKQRVAVLRAEIARIEAAKARGEVPRFVR